MKLVFMGTPDFALPCLRTLIQSRKHDIAFAITQPDKPKGRSKDLQMPPVKQLALEHGIRVLQPDRLKGNAEILRELKAAGPDAGIVVAYGKMIPDDMLEVPRYGFINVHASLLPHFRGAAPINRAIINGCSVTGVSIMQVDSGMDSGPVFMRSEIDIPEDEDASSLSVRLSELGAEKLMEAMDLLGEGRIAAVPQDHEKASLAPMLTKDEGRIDWSRCAKEIHDLVRGLIPWPCAYTSLGGKVLKILSSSYTSPAHDLPFGTLQKEGKGIRIACRDGFIIPEKVQLEGKKVMDAHAFSLGLHEKEILLG